MSGDVFCWEAFEHHDGTAAFSAYFGRWMADGAIAGIEVVGTGFGFGVAATLRVDRYDQSGAADGFRSADHAFGEGPDIGGIELVPDFAFVEFGYIFDRG